MDTLFKEASDTVQQYAANAFQTAGMSANEYMSTVTNFSASLIQSLGGDTEEAAEYANRAITDMADNANKMGTSMQSLQDAYRGFSRGNYTMLDNLALGYGGTQEEMQRLVAEAANMKDVQEELGVTVDANSMSFGNIVNAISVVQKEMGITGTTAAEASSTIQGSVSAAGSAWKNLVTGIADENADLDTLIGQFVDSVETAAGNLIPRVMQILSGMGAAIEQLAPILAAEVPGIITSVLPSLVGAGAQLLVGLTTGIISALPQLVASIPTIINSIVTAISTNFPLIAASGMTLISMFATGIGQAVPGLIGSFSKVIGQILNFITENLPSVLEKGVAFLNSLVNGILSAIPQMVSQLPQIISAFMEFVTENLPVIVDAGINLLLNFVTGIIQTIPQLVSQIPQIISAFTGGVVKSLPSIIKSGAGLLQKFIDGILSEIPNLVASLPQIINAIIDGIGALMDGIVDVGKSIVEGLWDGIASMAGWIGEKVTGFFSGIIEGAKGLLGIHSPSTVFAKMGENMALGLGQGWDSEYGRIRKEIEGGMSFGTANVDFASSGLGISSAGVVNGLSSAMQSGGGGNYIFNLLLPDGTRLASYILGPLTDYAKANGTPILNPTV